jgi:ubiquinone/menaquinone biosynthesis C-methylase UbiE
MKRRSTPELLDSDAGTAFEVAGSLRDLRWFNRWFGGVSTVRRLLEQAAGAGSGQEFSVLDVAAGEGYLAERMYEEFRHKGVRLRFALLDRSGAHLGPNGTMPKIAGEALRLPFQNASFDFVLTSLFVHHLAPEDAVLFAQEALRVCRSAVLVHDLIRHPLHLMLAYAGTPLYRSRITRNDAPASVWQAYTPQEMRGFFQQAGASDIEIRTHFLYRMGVIAWKTSRDDL